MWYTFDPEPPGDDCPDHGPHTGECPKCVMDAEVRADSVSDEATTANDE